MNKKMDKNIKTDKTKKIDVKRELISGIFIVIGALCTSLAMHVFMIPAKFAPGGVSGLASIFQNLIGFSASYTILILNAPLLVLSFIFLSRKFFVKTTSAILLSSVFLKVFQLTNFYTFFDPSSVILSAIAGGTLMGVGMGLLIKFGASTGGTDIISLLAQKKSNTMSISWMILIMNACVILLGGALYVTVGKINLTETITIVLYSFLGIFISSKIMDVVLNGVNSAVKFEVITTKPETLSKAIIERLHRGVTIVDSRGAYTKGENKIVICVVTRRQIAPFRRVLQDIDPNAFAFAIDAREVLGNGFNQNM